MSSAKHRQNWGREYPNLPKLDLIKVQKESWKSFLNEEFVQTIRSISPITDYTGNNWSLELDQVTFDPVVITPQLAKKKAVSYTVPVKVKAKLTNKRTNQVTEENVYFLNLPTMTPEGTFIINGIERGVISQLVRSPGIYFTAETDPSTGKLLHSAEIRPQKGSWLEFFIGKKGVIFARIDRKKKFAASIILRAACGLNDKNLMHEFGDYFAATIAADPTKTQEEAVIEFYKKIRPGEPIVLDNAQKFFNDRFFDLRTYELGMVGRYKINRKFGLELKDSDPKNWVLCKEDLISTVKYLVNLQLGKEKKIDDIDSLANRRLRGVGEIVSQVAIRPSLSKFERMIKERMSLISTKDKVNPSQLINPQPIISSLNTFFKQNQLSAILDQTNPLSELELLRRVTVIGTGGLTRERASFSIRDVHSSQYGKICTVRSPEGPNIGLVTYLALYSRINKYGFIEAPYRKVAKVGSKFKVNDEISYLSADDELDIKSTHLGVNIDSSGFIVDQVVPVRYQGDFSQSTVDQVQYIDMVPRQILGTSASLIPFVDHDEATRALMGSHMQCQAVPLISTERPIVGTGMEAAIAQAMHRAVLANHAGTVTYVDANKIIIKLDNKADPIEEKNGISEISKDGLLETYNLVKFDRTSPNGTCYNQKAIVSVGQKIKKDETIIDGPATDMGELAIGRNLLVAYASIDGLGFEDSFLISDRIVKHDLFTSIHIYEYVADVVDTKLGPEELTRDIPSVAEEQLGKLTEDGIVMIGANVGPNDILVGKVEPRGEKELTAEERLLRAIFGEKAREVKDTSLRVPNGEGGVVIKVDILDKDKSDDLDPGVNKVVKVYVAQIRRIQEGDKIAGRHGNKGVIARILPEYDMPRLEDGTPVDIVMSPLSVISRMNMGQVMETMLGYAGKSLEKTYAVPTFEKYTEDQIAKELTLSGMPVNGKADLYDGRTGKKYDNKVLVGVSYILKLHHMVDDKVHARSTGPYSLVTQQPLGGKARMGGQRLGEMEVWALEAHRAAHILQEMITLKSDDIEGRSKAFQSIIKGMPIPEPAMPESFKVLTKELAGLALEINPVGALPSSAVINPEGEISQEELSANSTSEDSVKEVANA